MTALAAMVSCQEQLIERQLNGALSAHVVNSPAVEVVTKAGETVPADNFTVYVKSADASYNQSYVYQDMPDVVMVPVGTYTVSAENVSEAASLSQPNARGQVRYYGETPAKEVAASTTPTEFDLTCKMANAAVSVVFGENIGKHFTDVKVTVYTVETRQLVFDAVNTAPAYFSPATLSYEFSGKFMSEETPMTVTGTKPLEAAKHLHLTFDISEQNGAVGKPTINVDSTCEDLYDTIMVDPTDKQ